MILAGAIVPVGLALAPSLHADTITLPATQVINSDNGTPIYREGLQEGFLSSADDEFTANPGNSTPELGLRMAQSIATGPDAWADNRTWVYTGQIFTGPSGVISYAFNNDDNDWLKINGVLLLNDNSWDTTVAGVANNATAGLTPGGLLTWAPNTWVNFEYRVGNGTGGAGPSGQNTNGASGWNTTTGAVMSWSNEFSSTNADSYIGGLNDLGRPTEIADGTPTLFRYQFGLGVEDNYRLEGDSTLTINGANPSILVSSLSFLDTATAATLTVEDGTDTGDINGFIVHKTLSFNNGTSFTANNQALTVSGTSDVRLGRISDGAFTGTTITAAQAAFSPGQLTPGKLILDHVDTANASDLSGTTLRVGADGHLVVRGSNGVNPIATLTEPLT
ncbi:MAG: hypothetical protein EOP84_31290, partial [Verrucomicrobiaceae bacterium]